jgi:hypothetical protein
VCTTNHTHGFPAQLHGLHSGYYAGDGNSANTDTATTSCGNKPPTKNPGERPAKDTHVKDARATAENTGKGTQPLQIDFLA